MIVFIMLDIQLFSFLLLLKIAEGIPGFEELCPYNKFCDVSPHKNVTLGQQQSCCQECSCDASCTLLGNCCPNMPAAGTIRPRYPCTNLITYYFALTGKYIADHYQVGFHIIDDCPRSGDEVLYPRCYEPVDIQDYALVSDVTTEHVYKNKHCAACHGAREIVSWNIVVSKCKDLYSRSFQSYRERDQYIKEYCAFYSMPQNINVGKTMCYPDEHPINYCGISGYDEDVVNACLKSRPGTNTLYFDEQGETLVVYANVYCYKCNQPIGSKDDNICRKRFLEIERNIHSIGFTAILSFNDGHDVFTEAKETDCKRGEIYDRYSSICRQLICPVGYVADSGRCKTGVDRPDGVSISLTFELDLNGNSLSLDKQLLALLTNKINFIVSNDKITCGICFSQFGRADSMSNIVFQVQLYSNSTCSTHHLFAQAHIMALNGRFDICLPEHKTSICVSLRVILRPLQLNSTIYVTSNIVCWDVVFIDMRILEYCPGIRLSVDELKMFALTRDNDTSTSMNQTDTQFICWVTYEKMRQVNSAESVFQKIKETYYLFNLTVLVICFKVLLQLSLHCH